MDQGQQTFHSVALQSLRAFAKVTGLAVRLLPLDARVCGRLGQAAHRPFCQLITRNPKGRTLCERFVKSLQTHFCSQRRARCFCCPVGLMELVVPVMMAGSLVALLLCGQVPRHGATPRNFARAMVRLRHSGVRLDRRRAAKAYFGSGAGAAVELQAAAQLLTTLANQLGDELYHVWLNAHDHEPNCVQAAKVFAQQHLSESFTTRRVAAAANISPQYLCRAFKRATGLTFADYHCRIRVQKARELLADPTQRISDVAAAAGFESIPYFNRAFKRHVGASPSQYRAALPA